MNVVITDLTSIAGRYRAEKENATRRVIVCAGTGCVAGGALQVHGAFLEEINARGLAVRTELASHDEEDAGGLSRT